MATPRQTRSQTGGARAEIDRAETSLSSRVAEAPEETRRGRGERCRASEAGRSDSLEGSARTSGENPKWEYSAPPVPADHWNERGFGADYVEAMESFLEGMRDTACKLRGGDYEGGDLHIGGGDANLRHDDALLPHWREFADALQFFHLRGDIGDLSLSDLQLPSVVLDMLIPPLALIQFKSFTLAAIDFADASDGGKFATEIIRSNQNLKEFCWIDIPIDSMEQANCILDAIVRHPSLDSICIENCFGAQSVIGFDMLCSILSRDNGFSSVEFDSNNIRTVDTQLPEFLATNPPLRELLLANNNLGDRDAMSIANSLKRNTNLVRLDLGRNDITDSGVEALRTAVFDSTSLNSAAESNHACHIIGLDLGDIPDNIVSSSCAFELNTFLRNRGEKIYSLLSSRNKERTNAHHLGLEFGEDALKLAPKVLECVNLYSGRLRPPYFIIMARPFENPRMELPLSIMYEMLRGWQMPELYENHISI